MLVRRELVAIVIIIGAFYMNDSTRLVTRREAAAELRISIRTLNRHLVAGNLKGTVVGTGRQNKWIAFTREELDRFIAQQQKAGPYVEDELLARESGTRAPARTLAQILRKV